MFNRCNKFRFWVTATSFWCSEHGGGKFKINITEMDVYVWLIGELQNAVERSPVDIHCLLPKQQVNAGDILEQVNAGDILDQLCMQQTNSPNLNVFIILYKPFTSIHTGVHPVKINQARPIPNPAWSFHNLLQKQH